MKVYDVVWLRSCRVGPLDRYDRILLFLPSFHEVGTSRKSVL